MKYIFILVLLFTSLLSDTSKKQKVTIGIGPYIQTQPYKDVTPIFVPSPVIFFDNSLFYVRWSRFGMYFLGNKGEKFSWGLSLTAQPRTYGYKPKDSSYLKGMDERKNTLEGGLALSMSYNKEYIEIMALTDTLERYQSWILKTEIGTETKFGKFSFYPSLIFIYQSDDFINYYYGVKKSEATLNRAQYSPKVGMQIGAQTYINYPITDNLATLINIRADLLPPSARNSPLVASDTFYSGLVSLIYTFEY